MNLTLEGALIPGKSTVEEIDLESIKDSMALLRDFLIMAKLRKYSSY